MRELLLTYFANLSTYWASQHPTNSKEACEGLLFSILTTFDGGSAHLPAFDIIPCPHETDKEYFISLGKNYFVNEVINDCALHEIVIFNK